MNQELEALILAFDAVRLATTGEQIAQREAVFQSKIDEVLTHHPGINREKLIRSVDLAHRRWVLAQQKPSALPPKA